MITLRHGSNDGRGGHGIGFVKIEALAGSAK